MMSRLRIFVSSSGLSTLYMSIYARKSYEKGQVDLLFIDALALKPSQRELIYEAAQYHSFEGIFDLSRSLDEASSQVPGKIKQLTRKLKTHAVIKPIYDFLYSYKLKQEDQQHLHDVMAIAGDYLTQGYESVELLLQPVLHLNPSLIHKFPEATIRFFEHGLGDYLDLESKRHPEAHFHCVFAEELKKYHEQIGRTTDRITPLLGHRGFEELDAPFLQLFPQLGSIVLPSGKPIALIATQALAQFQVDPGFWDFFFSSCLKQIESPQDYIFLIKPHPRQEADVLEEMKYFFERKSLEVILWEDPALKSLNMEILFDKLKDQVSHVFSPFSSTLFYLSKLYPDEGIRYYYSLHSLIPFLQHTPELYKDRWKTLHPYLKHVFGQNAIEM